MSTTTKGSPKGAGEKLVATNPSRSNFFIDEVVEAGLALTGTEIKSLRTQSPNLRDSYVDISPSAGKNLEAWLLNSYIAPYTHGNVWNHEPKRKRKLLLHRYQIERMHGAITQKSMTIIPTRLYLKNGRAKIELGLGKGKKKSDKRESVKKKAADREMAQAIKKNR